MDELSGEEKDSLARKKNRLQTLKEYKNEAKKVESEAVESLKEKYDVLLNLIQNMNKKVPSIVEEKPALDKSFEEPKKKKMRFVDEKEIKRAFVGNLPYKLTE